MAACILTAETLREILSYNPETGEFHWKVNRGTKARAGQLAGHSEESRGYTDIRIDGKKYRAHRLAWLYVHGEWPADLIDHANGCKRDNRLSNLRLASHAENARNHSATGVTWCERHQTWRASISMGFKDREDALAAREIMAKFVYGEFARTVPKTKYQSGAK